MATGGPRGRGGGCDFSMMAHWPSRCCGRVNLRPSTAWPCPPARPGAKRDSCTRRSASSMRAAGSSAPQPQRTRAASPDERSGAAALAAAAPASTPATAPAHARRRARHRRGSRRCCAPLRAARGAHRGRASAELEAIAAWCGARLARSLTRACSSCSPARRRARERLAALIREVLDPCDSVRVAQRATGHWWASRAAALRAAAAAGAGARRALRCWAVARPILSPSAAGCMAPQWLHPPRRAARSARASAATARVHEPDSAGTSGTLQLAPAGTDSRGARTGWAAAPRARPAFSAETPRSAAALGGALRGGARRPHLAGRRGRAIRPRQQTRLRWRELLEEFGDARGRRRRFSARGRRCDLVAALARRTAYRPADEDVPVMLSPCSPIRSCATTASGWHHSARTCCRAASRPIRSCRCGAAGGRACPQPGGAAAPRAGADAARGLGARQRAELVLSVPAREGDLELLPSPSARCCTARCGLPAPQRLACRPAAPRRIHRGAGGRARPAVEPRGAAARRDPLPHAAECLSVSRLRGAATRGRAAQGTPSLASRWISADCSYTPRCSFVGAPARLRDARRLKPRRAR